MTSFLLKQVNATLGYKFYVDGTGNENLYNLNSTSSILTILDRFIGSIISVPFTAIISNNYSNNQITFKKKFGFIFEHYKVFNGNDTIASINRGKNLFTPEVYIHSIYGNFSVKTTLMARSFDIIQDGVTVATIKKASFSLKDAYEVSNFYFDDISLLIAIAFSLDNMFHS